MPRSLIRIVLETPQGEVKHAVPYDGRDVRAYEAEFSESALTRTDYSQICKIAFCAMRRQGTFVGSWELFDGQCVDAEDELDEPADQADGEVDPARPTRPAPGDDS